MTTKPDLIARLEAEKCNFPDTHTGLARIVNLCHEAAAALRAAADPSAEAVAHKQGCEALGGYGHGIGPCSCGAASTSQREPGMAAVIEQCARVCDDLETENDINQSQADGMDMPDSAIYHKGARIELANAAQAIRALATPSAIEGNKE